MDKEMKPPSLSAKSVSVLIIITAALLLCAAVPHDVWGFPNGIYWFSGNPATNGGLICTDCHAFGTLPTVTITGPTSLASGASGTYTLTITGGAAVVGGLDVSATAGTLTASGANTHLLNGEITHTFPTFFSGGTLSFEFTLTAPASGQAVLYGAGLSADGDGGAGGDYAAKATLTVTVTAATAPAITVTDPVPPPDDLQMAFGTVTDDDVTSSLTVTVGNAGNANLVIGSIGVVKPLTAPFSIPTDNCSGETITPSGTCTIVVRFAPTAVGLFSESFDIPSNDPTTPSVTFSVSGTGSAAPEPQITVTDPVAPPDDLTLPFGTVQNGLSSVQTITVGNSGDANLVVGTVAAVKPLTAPFSITADNCSGNTIAPSGFCTIALQFAPTQSGTFSGSFDIPSNDPTTPSVTFSVSGSGNNPPTVPQQVSPANGQTGVASPVTLEWKPSTDPDGDAVNYHVYCCTDSTFATCTPVTAQMKRTAGIYLALSSLLFAGFAVRKRARGKAMFLILMATLLLSTGIIITACGSSSSVTPPAPPSNVTSQVSGLTSGSTYYWKVVADDGKGGLATSPTWSFSAK